jgi:hypothetical protein
MVPQVFVEEWISDFSKREALPPMGLGFELLTHHMQRPGLTDHKPLS